MRQFTKKLALAFGVTLMAAGLNTTRAQVGAALNFDGVNDFVDCGLTVTNALKNKDKFTVETWVYPTQNTAGKSIVGNHQSFTQFNIQHTTTNQFSFFIGFGTYGLMTAPNTVTLNTWHHVAGVFDDTVLRLYLNGVLTGTLAVPSTYVLDVNCAIPVRIGRSGFGGEEFQGSIDEVRIWDVARTTCEINTYKNCEIPSNAPGLLVNYHFNQGVASANNATVTTLIDATTNATTGTLTSFGLTGATSNWVAPGGVVSGFTTTPAQPTVAINPSSNITSCLNNTVVLTASGAISYTWSGGVTNAVAFTASATTAYTVNATAANGCTAVPAVANVSTTSCPGEALSVDGINDYVECGSAITSSLSGTNKVTVEAWVKPFTNTGLGVIVGNYATPTPNLNMQFMLRRDNNNFVFGASNGSIAYITSAATVTLNTWTHLAGTWDGSVMKLYVNGILSGTNTLTGNFPTISNTVWIGGDAYISGGEYFKGSIDEVRIWKVDKSQCDIRSNMNSEIPSNATNLLANYHFNQGVAFANNSTVTTLIDATTNAFTGTLTNIALAAGNINSNWVSPGGVVAGYTTAVAAPGYTNSTLAICPGGTVVLGSTNATSYTWTPSVTNNAPFTPTASSTYTYAGTNSVTTCSNISIVSVTVNPNPTVTAVSSETNVLCVGQSATLTAGGAASYVWNTTATTAVIAVSPTVTTTYTVTGTNSNGCSNVAMVTQSISACTGIAVNSNEVSMEIYPNPSNGIFNINASSNVTIEVFDVLGSLILKTTLNSGEYKLNLSEQNNGLYILKCTSLNQVKSYRLFKD